MLCLRHMHLYSLRHDTRLMMHVTATPTHVHANRTIWTERMRGWWDLGNERWMNGELMNAWMQVTDTQDSRTMPNRQPRTKGTLWENRASASSEEKFPVKLFWKFIRTHMDVGKLYLRPVVTKQTRLNREYMKSCLFITINYFQSVSL